MYASSMCVCVFDCGTHIEPKLGTVSMVNKLIVGDMVSA